MSKLLLCVRCERHVRRDERTCPFCFAQLPKPKEPSTALGPVLTRAALLVAGAAAGAAVGGCADDPDAETETGSEEDGLEQNGGKLEEDHGMAQPAYGVPIDDSDLVQPAYGVPVDPPTCDPPLPQPAYGVPVDPDAGVRPPSKRDAGPLPQPAYGVPVDPDAGDVQPIKRDAGVPLPQPAYGVPVDNT